MWKQARLALSTAIVAALFAAALGVPHAWANFSAAPFSGSAPAAASGATLDGTQTFTGINTFNAFLTTGISPGATLGVIPASTRGAVCLDQASPSSTNCQLYDIANTTVLNGGAINIATGGTTRAGLDGTGKFFIGASGTPIASSIRGTAALDFASAAAGACSAVLTITVTGAVAGTEVALGVPNAADTAGSTFSAWVSATSTVSVKHCCFSGTCDPASATFSARATNP